MNAIQRQAMQIYANASKPSERLKLLLFLLKLKLKAGSSIAIEPSSALEKGSGYIHARALIESGFLTLNPYERTVSFTYNEQTITLAYEHPLFFRGICAVAANFLIHSDIPFNCAEAVIDLGATIGDTALLAAYGGARNIHAYEPYPFPYKLMCENIKLNYCQGQIIPYNEAIGGNRRFLKLDNNFKDSIGANLDSDRIWLPHAQSL